MISSPIHAVFFDFDGLIVDTEWPIYQAWLDTFQENGHPLPLETFTQCIGTDFNTWSPKTHLEDLTGKTFDWDTLDIERQNKINRNLEGAPALPGIPEAVTAGATAGLKLAVVSSSSHGWVDNWLERISLFDPFHTTVCRGDAPRIKPEPDLYLEASRQFSIDPANCLVVEDSVNGLKAAQAAGMQSVAIPNRVTAGGDFSIADRIFETAHELADFLADL